MRYEKHYGGLVLWLVLFVAAMLAAAFLPLSAAWLTRITCALCTVGVAALTLVVLKTGAVYWYNGTTFEEAAAAGPKRREAFARKAYHG